MKRRFMRSSQSKLLIFADRTLFYAQPIRTYFACCIQKIGRTERSAIMAKTAGDILVECLIEWGVNVIFGLPGDGINGVFEALRTRQDQIRFVQVRHEEAAAFM